MLKSYSQSLQDLFAVNVCKTKTYIEVGASWAVARNNTYLLEDLYNFKGFSVERTKSKKENWQQNKRKNRLYISDAVRFDYIKAIKENSLDMHIGYLSCDIEPPNNTFQALVNIIEAGISFDCITFEDERFENHKQDYSTKAIEFLKPYGYIAVINDVYPLYKPFDKTKIYETWMVHESIEFKPTSFELWMNDNNINESNIQKIKNKY